MIEFTLDGRIAHARPGRRLLSITRRPGTAVFIPTLCHDDKLAPWRLPHGRRRRRRLAATHAGGATRVGAGMVVATNSGVPQLRRTLTEMLLSEHLNADPGGRPNELTDIAGSAPRRRSCSRTPSATAPTRNRLMGYRRTRASSATAMSFTPR